MTKYIVEHIGLTDVIFKEIFKHKYILVAYLKALGIKVEEEDILFDILEVNKTPDLKGVRFDIRIKNGNTRINLEAQRRNVSGKNKKEEKVSSKEYQTHRKIHYISVLHSEAYQKGEQYFESPKSYVIFLYENKSCKKWIERTRLVNLETKEEYNDIEIIEVSLEKAPRNQDLFKVLIEDDLTKYLKKKTIVKEVAEMIYEMNASDKRRALKIFREQQERVARDAKELRENEIYFDAKAEGKMEGFTKGKAEGKIEGKAEGKLDIAKKLKELGSAEEFIVEATGLSLETVKTL